MNDYLKLRHSIQPYIGIGTIFFIILLVTDVLSLIYKTNSWESSWVIILIAVCFFGGWFYLNNKYKIVWKDGDIVESLSGADDQIINVQDISQIICETSIFPPFRRPYRRIAIYTKRDVAKSIDISLKHFKKSDIRNILSKISLARPELSIPSI